jgi:hypothetical protein
LESNFSRPDSVCGVVEEEQEEEEKEEEEEIEEEEGITLWLHIPEA